MPRLVTSAAVCLVVVLLSVWAARRWVGEEAIAKGRNLHRTREQLKKVLAQQKPDERLVVWLGDSTIVAVGHPSYPQLMQPTLRAAGIETRVVAAVGLDPYHFYFLMGPILDWQPDVLVLVAHVRLFRSQRPGAVFTDLASFIPTGELARVIGLPLHERGISIPRLLLAQTLRVQAVEENFYLFEGLRRMFRDSTLWDVLGPSKPTGNVSRWAPALQGALATIIESYNTPLTKRQPVVRMLGAAVAAARRHGTAVLVIVSPIPYQFLRLQDAYDPVTFAKRVDVLRATVEASGGTLLDLHRALADGEFRDKSGHYTPDGARRVADLVTPHVWHALGEARDGGPNR